MSRIDEARRRAGNREHDDQPPGELAPNATEATADAVALAQEEYPVESPEAPRPHRPAEPQPRQPRLTSVEPSASKTAGWRRCCTTRRAPPDCRS